MPPVGSQFPARDRDATRISNAPSAPRMISWLVKPYRCSELATRCPFWSYSVKVQNRAAGVTPLTTTSQRPSSGRLRLSVVAENATPSPVPTGNSPLRAIEAREYGSTSAVPVLGRAVQAPIVSVPRSVPRVAVIHVAPRPTTVARKSASRVMNISRTGQFLRGAAVAALPGVAAAKLSGKGTELDDTGLIGFAGSPAVLAASSSNFSTRTRISAPRLVRIGGGPGFNSGGFGAAPAAIAAVTTGGGSLVPA